jgi:hypothetical protein
MLSRMDPNSLAEALPSLYRAILDRVAELEASGHRPEAGRVRATATQIYSRAWDERARRQLTELLARNTRPVEGGALGRTGHGRFRGRRAGSGTAAAS